LARNPARQLQKRPQKRLLRPPEECSLDADTIANTAILTISSNSWRCAFPRRRSPSR